MVTDYDLLTGQAITREATAEELAGFNVVNDDEIARRQAEADKADAKAALLQRLNITAEEAAILIS